MRTLSTIALSVCLTALCACGGAAGGPGTGQGALLQGKVVSVDGSGTDLAGIVIESLADGGVAVTGTDGSFQFRVRPGDPIILKFEDPDHPDRGDDEPGRDPSEEGDDTPDGADIDGDEVEIEGLDEDERCEIEVEIEDGDVVECRVEHPDRDREGDEGPRFEAECRLKPAEDTSEPEAVAEAELVCEGDCCVLEVEVAHVFFSAELIVAIACGDEVEEIGVIEIRERSGHFEIHSCRVDRLPFGVESVHDLRECTLLLLDEDGEVAFSGCIPAERDEEKDEEEGEGEEDEEEREGEEDEEERDRR